jgi:sugar lactone lactonase YvrE
MSKGNLGVVLSGEHQLFDKRSGDVGGICVDSSGNIYVADPIYNIILKILPNGTVILWAGKTGVSGNNGNNRVKGNDAMFYEPTGLSIDRSGNLYIADRGNNQIRRITPDQYVTLVAGSPSGLSGFRSGIGSNALFNSPNDISVDKSGNIYVADTDNHAIRLIKNGTSQVMTVAGNGTAGDGYNGWNIDGSMQAILNSPYSIAAKPNGEVYIMDSGNHKIKLLDKNNRVLRFSGSGVEGSYLGDALTSQYNNLCFSDVDPSGNLYVIDFKGYVDSRLLKINGNGIPAIIRDFASFDNNWIWENGDNAIWEDGNNAVFDVIISEDNIYVVGAAVNNSGVLYVSESQRGRI